MISWPSLFLILAVLLGILYIALGVIANSYVKQGSKMKYFDWVMSLGVSWAFFDDRYEISARKLLTYGKVVILIELVAFIAWGSQFVHK